MDSKTLAIIALVLAILLAPIGLILGIIALVQAKKYGGEGKELAIAAIIVGVIMTITVLPTLLAAIGAIFYFGVLSPEKFLPEKCVLTPGLACESYKVEPTQITLVITNNLEIDITVNSIDVEGCSGAFSTDMISGDEKTFILSTNCNNGASKDAFKGDITLKYTEKATGLTKIVYGNLATKVN